MYRIEFDGNNGCNFYYANTLEEVRARVQMDGMMEVPENEIVYRPGDADTNGIGYYTYHAKTYRSTQYELVNTVCAKDRLIVIRKCKIVSGNIVGYGDVMWLKTVKD